MQDCSFDNFLNQRIGLFFHGFQYTHFLDRIAFCVVTQTLLDAPGSFHNSTGDYVRNGIHVYSRFGFNGSRFWCLGPPLPAVPVVFCLHSATLVDQALRELLALHDGEVGDGPGDHFPDLPTLGTFLVPVLGHRALSTLRAVVLRELGPGVYLLSLEVDQGLALVDEDLFQPHEHVQRLEPVFFVFYLDSEVVRGVDVGVGGEWVKTVFQIFMPILSFGR